MPITIHPSPGARGSITPSSSGADKKGRGHAGQEPPRPDRDTTRGCCSSTSLRAIGQAISRELQELGTSIRARAARIATSRTSAQAFVEAFSVIPSSQGKTPRAQGASFENIDLPQTQDQIAKQLGLPNSCPKVRDGKAADLESHSQYKLPEVLELDSLRKMPPTLLKKLIAYSLANRTAENLYFIFSAQHLLASNGSERTHLASKMQRAFTAQDAPLALNLKGQNQKAVQQVLSELASGRSPTNLDQVLTQACNNLLLSFGPDVYRNFLRKEIHS